MDKNEEFLKELKNRNVGKFDEFLKEEEKRYDRLILKYVLKWLLIIGIIVWLIILSV